MLKDNLNVLLAEAMRDKDKVKLEVIRSIKSAFGAYETQKNAKPLDEPTEISIIKKLRDQRVDSAEQYRMAGRNDLYNSEMEESLILNTFIPVEPTEDDIEAWLEFNNYHCISKREMGQVISEVKSHFPSANGKMVAKVVKDIVYD